MLKDCGTQSEGTSTLRVHFVHYNTPQCDSHNPPRRRANCTSLSIPRNVRRPLPPYRQLSTAAKPHLSTLAIANESSKCSTLRPVASSSLASFSRRTMSSSRNLWRAEAAEGSRRLRVACVQYDPKASCPELTILSHRIELMPSWGMWKATPPKSSLSHRSESSPPIQRSSSK